MTEKGKFKDYSFYKKWFQIMKLSIDKKEIDSLYINGYWCYSIFKKLLVQKLIKSYWSRNGIDELWFCGDGSNLLIIKNVENLKNYFENNYLIPGQNYFRIRQFNFIGWYVINNSISKE